MQRITGNIGPQFLALFFALVFLFTCAERDNPYDPQNIGYVNTPPHFSVRIDSNSLAKIIDTVGADTLRIKPVGRITFTCYNITDDGDSAGYGLDSLLCMVYLNNSWKQSISLTDSVVNVSLSDTGMYHIRFRAQDKEHAVSYKNFWFISISNRPPLVLSLTKPGDTVFVTHPEYVPFSASVIDTDGQVTRIEWKVDGIDSMVYLSTSSRHDTLRAVYNARVYSNGVSAETLTVRAFDTEGLFGTRNLVFFIKNVSPVNKPPVIYSVTCTPLAVLVDSAVTFKVSARDTDGVIASYTWYFGGGATAADSLVTHAFDSAGQYEVTVRVTDDSGTYSADTVRVYVYDSLPLLAPVSITGFSGVTTASLSLSWTMCTYPTFVSYGIYRSLDSAVSLSSVLVSTIGNQGITGYTDNNLSPNTTYFYSVYVFTDTVYVGSPIKNCRTEKMTGGSPPFSINVSEFPQGQGAAIDGTIESAWGEPNLEIPSFASLPSLPVEGDNSDCSMKAWFRYDTEALYIAVKVTDDLHRLPNGAGENAQYDDSFILFTNPDYNDVVADNTAPYFGVRGKEIIKRTDESDNSVYWYDPDGSGKMESFAGLLNLSCGVTAGSEYTAEYKLTWGGYFANMASSTSNVAVNLGFNDNDSGIPGKDGLNSAIRWTATDNWTSINNAWVKLVFVK